MNRDFTPGFTSLSAVYNMAAEQTHSVLVESLFLGCSSSVLSFTAYGTASKVFGLEIDTLLSDYERYRFKRSLLKMFARRRRDQTR